MPVALRVNVSDIAKSPKTRKMLNDANGPVGTAIRRLGQSTLKRAESSGGSGFVTNDNRWKLGYTPVGRNFIGESDIRFGQENRGGNLRDSHKGTFRRGSSRRGPRYEIINEAAYAQAVYLGTSPIASMGRGRGMVWETKADASFPTKAMGQFRNAIFPEGRMIAKTMGGATTWQANFVRGQPAKPWLRCGYNLAASRFTQTQWKRRAGCAG